MIKFFLSGGIAALLCLGWPMALKAQTWQWAWGAGGRENDNSNSITTDAAGNVYVAGVFASPSVAFGTTTLMNVNGGYGDAYVAKYNPMGAVLWAKSIGSNDNERARAVAVDKNGNVYVAGVYDGATLTVGSTTLTNGGAVGTMDMFLVKYDTAGNVVWVKGGSGTNLDAVVAIGVDTVGGVYIAGNFASPSLMLGATTLTNAGGGGTSDVFIAKYTSSGVLAWAKNGNGTLYDNVGSLAVDPSGCVYLSGSFLSSSLAFDGVTLSNANAGMADMYLVKYSPSGTALHGTRIGNTYDELCSAIAADKFGHVYALGYSYSSSLSIASSSLTGTGMFLAKLDSLCTPLWAKRNGAPLNDNPSAIATGNTGQVYVTGYYSNASISFGSFSVANTSPGTQDIFVAQYDSSGNAMMVKNVGGTDNDFPMAIAVDKSDNLYVAGYYGSASLSTGALSVVNNGSPGTTDAFLAKYSSVSNSVGFTDKPVNNVFPNPADKTLFVNLHASALRPDIAVFDCVGRPMNMPAMHAANGSAQIDVSEFPEGIYYLKILDGNWPDMIPFAVAH